MPDTNARSARSRLRAGLLLLVIAAGIGLGAWRYRIRHRPPYLPPAEIMARMARAYASCASYQDTGSVTTTFYIGKPHFRFGRPFFGPDTETEEKPFRTAFVRPGRFYFEYRSHNAGAPDERYVIWMDGGEAQSWWTFQGSAISRSGLDMAVAGATGVSGGSAHTVPGLLLPEQIGGGALMALTDLRYNGTASVDGVECYELVGRDLLEDMMTLRVNAQTFLLREMVERRKIDDADVETTRLYRPQMNREIDPKTFAFVPPK
jgi:hypothetical protein